MKKTYLTPCTNVLRVQTEQIVAESLSVNNNTRNDIVGDVKGGDWGDIFSNEGGITSDSPFED